MKRAKIAVAAIAVVLVIVLVLQNTQGVEATVLFYTGSMPLAALILLSFAVGVVAGLLTALSIRSKRKSPSKRS